MSYPTHWRFAQIRILRTKKSYGPMGLWNTSLDSQTYPKTRWWGSNEYRHATIAWHSSPNGYHLRSLFQLLCSRHQIQSFQRLGNLQRPNVSAILLLRTGLHQESTLLHPHLELLIHPSEYGSATSQNVEETEVHRAMIAKWVHWAQPTRSYILRGNEYHPGYIGRGAVFNMAPARLPVPHGGL